MHFIVKVVNQDILLALIFISFDNGEQLTFARRRFLRQVFEECNKSLVGNIINS